MHHLRPCERLGKEDRLRVLRLHLGDQTFPQCERLGMGVIDSEYPDALLGPEEDDVDQFPAKRVPVFVFEDERVYVLVSLRRVFRVLNRAVRPSAEPLRMFLEVRMIGRALERYVERYVDPMFRCLRGQAPEIGQRSKLRMDGHVASGLIADRPWAARVSGAGHGSVVGALTLCVTDRVDRRQVQHVETHRRDVGQPFFAVSKGPVLPRLGAARAREHLVPGRKARPGRIHHDFKLSRVAALGSAVRMSRRQGSDFSGERQSLFVAGARTVRSEGLRHFRELASRCPGCAGGRFIQQLRAD